MAANLQDILKEQGLLIHGHFRLGGHLYDEQLCVTDYILKEEILLRPSNLDLFGHLLASSVPPALLDPDIPVVVGIERGGRILAGSVALHLSRKLKLPNLLVCVTARRVRRGFVVDPREEPFLAQHTRAIVVEDFLVKGKKIKQAMGMIAPYDIKAVAIVALAHRGEFKSTVPLYTALTLDQALEFRDCRICDEGGTPDQAPGDDYPDERKGGFAG